MHNIYYFNINNCTFVMQNDKILWLFLRVNLSKKKKKYYQDDVMICVPYFLVKQKVIFPEIKFVGL